MEKIWKYILIWLINYCEELLKRVTWKGKGIRRSEQKEKNSATQHVYIHVTEDE